MALMGGVIRNANTHATLAFATACITGTLTCYGTDGSGIWNNLRDNATTGYEGISITCSAGGFNPVTVNLVAADIAFYPGIGYGYWKVVELPPAPPPPTCFTPDTLVIMADGSAKPISEISVGDYVVGQGGSINRVCAIEQPYLGDRRLYALDGGKPFITNEHPILTDRGWAAVDPAATARENPELAVVPLQIGDVLHRIRSVRVPAMVGGLAERAGVELETVTLARLEAVEDDPGLTLYNLLLEGEHTYFAHGYLVHNKTSSH
jgi:hypothetical protein